MATLYVCGYTRVVMTIKLTGTPTKSTYQITIIIVLVSLLIISSVIVFAKLNRDQYVQNITTNMNSIKQLRDSLTAIPLPKDIETGQKDSSAAYLVHQLTNLRKNRIHVIQDPPLLVCASHLPKLCCGHTDENGEAFAQSLHQVYATISYHEATMKALRPLLEYNPEADLGGERLNQPQITMRIDAASQGIAKTLSALNKAPSLEDTSKAELVSTVTGLQSELASFEKTSDKSAWYKAVNEAQKTIISNRQAYWESTLADNYLVLDELLQRLNSHKYSLTT